MMFSNVNSVLVLAPHTDDGELGAGGTISKLVNMGVKVTYVAFSAAEDSIPSGFDKNATRREVALATSILGIKNENLSVLDFPVRRLCSFRQEILDKLIELRATIDPDLILLPSSDDVHQDHQVINREGIRAFKNRTILGYELVWNEFKFNSQLLVSLTESNVKSKYDSLLMYKTQFGRPYMSKDFIYGLAKTRGVQVGVDYAEAFEVIRCVIK